MKKITTYIGLMFLLLFQSQIATFSQEIPTGTTHRVLTASQTAPTKQQHNKTISKQLHVQKQAIKSNPHLFHSLLGKIFYYVGGKPSWVSPYDKNIHKPLSAISSSFKDKNTFYKSLYQVQEAPFQADIEAKIFFQSGEHTLSARNQTQFNNLLKVIYQTLHAHPQKDLRSALKISIEVAGFTDSKPFYAQQPQELREKSNLTLSQKRAEQVAAYLLNDLNGRVAQISVKAQGYGEALPPFSTDSEISDAQRRICFVKVYFLPQNSTLPEYPVYEDLSTMPGM